MVLSTAEGPAPVQAEQPSGQSAAEEPLDARFSTMLEQLRQWRQRYYDCLVPRKVPAAAATAFAACARAQSGEPIIALPTHLALPHLAPTRALCEQVHDARELGEWVHRQRALRKRGELSAAAVAALDDLGFAWKVDVITAKWYHNLHAARRYRVRERVGGCGQAGGRAKPGPGQALG